MHHGVSLSRRLEREPRMAALTPLWSLFLWANRQKPSVLSYASVYGSSEGRYFITQRDDSTPWFK